MELTNWPPRFCHVASSESFVNMQATDGHENDRAGPAVPGWVSKA
jgi:hypothetical protein